MNQRFSRAVILSLIFPLCDAFTISGRTEGFATKRFTRLGLDLDYSLTFPRTSYAQTSTSLYDKWDNLVDEDDEYDDVPYTVRLTFKSIFDIVIIHFLGASY